MVADKLVSTLPENSACGDGDDVTLGEPCDKPHGDFEQTKMLELGTNSQLEPSLDNFCEVVVSYRCKFCSYEANDIGAVKTHVNEIHVGKNRKNVSSW
ncbi:unnamed protein product [Allacma fusca]|uniref:C2H2-type domain-containing protein n=1 Tax=Allacma fusca TaxID=39272 RepID=A0A8J2PZT6_9HEXA|nr:unnamed protein product [Allacma fusca]